MKRHPRPRRLAALLGALVLALTGASPAQYEIDGGVFNDLSQRPGGIPVGPGGTPSGEPTITPQFSNVVETSGSAGPIATGSLHPSSSGVVLERASIGTTFASGVPRYFLGDRIAPPASYVSSSGQLVPTDPSFWRAEPVRPGEIITNPSGDPLADAAGAPIPHTGGVIIPLLPEGVLESFYYSPHAKAVFAYEPGRVQIWWRSRLPDADGNYVLLQDTFSVSSSTSNPVRTFYWTEKSFNGPRITVPGGRIVTVNPVFSNVFPATVETEYVVPGSSPPADDSAQPAAELRTVWYEKNNGVGELHAYNLSGRIMIEYLGELQDDGSHAFLGADVVDVTQAADPTTLTVFLGDEIRPGIEDRTLAALPVDNSGSSDSVSYYGSFARPDGSLAYYAERANDIEDRVVFYWMETLDAAIPATAGTTPGLSLNWPKYLHKYLQVWPDDVGSFAHYTVGHDGSSIGTGTGLKFEGGKIPSLIFQDDLEQDEAAIDAVTQRLLVDLGGDQLNRTLLKFTGDNGGVWYVRLMTQAEDRDGFQESDGGPALTGTAYVGHRIEPPTGDYSLAGYVAGGTSYSPSAYKDPFATGIATAETGAIIPVNALPGDDNPLTIWWFKEVTPPSSEFSSFFTPAKVGRYSVAWSEDDPAIVLASNEGSGDLTGAQNTGFIYVQNDATKPGYNPNEEHALLLGGRAYALRDDLNVITGNSYTSQPRVLLQYPDPVDHRPTMICWEVLREDAQHRFDYPITAGTIINSPMPLPLLPLPVDPATGQSRNAEVAPDPDLHAPEASPATGSPSYYTSFTFKDRKGYDWVYRGPHQPDESGLPASAPLANTEFNASSTGYWTHTLKIDQPTVASGVYAGTGEGDAQISTQGLPHFPADEVPTLEIRFRASSNVSTQVFWGNEDGGFGGGRSFTVPYHGAGDWQVLTFPLSTSEQWAGKTINALRFDPVTAAGTTFEIDWIRASATVPALGMEWYYTMRSGFFIPGLATQPAEGTILPYLRPKNSDGSYQGDPVTGHPTTVIYRPSWPEDSPSMSVGETLTLANHGLPSVRGQSSAHVLYQQSTARSGAGSASVTLHDPTRAKTVLLNDPAVGLTTLPASIATTPSAGKTYFQLLPPHLQQRFYYDPSLGDLGGLVFIGEFVDELAGEDYLLLNTLSPDDTASLKALVSSTDNDAQAWYNAVDRLSTKVETFIEDPAKAGTYIADSSRTVTVGGNELAVIDDSDTAVDSYALTATGTGSGYVTLLFGNGSAFTPQGEPVSLSIVRVASQLYTGDLKTLGASNPLDEQTSLRHSGDFAAHPESYEFEWRYAPPQDGVQPPVYTYTMETVLGGTDTRLWFLAQNPTAPLPSSYPATEYEFPRTFAINDSSHDPGSTYPGVAARSVSGLQLDGAIPSRFVFSANLGTRDGFILYVNGTAALASRLPAGVSAPAGTLADARTGLSANGLTYQYEVLPSYFTAGNNRIEVALYSSADPDAVSSLDFRLDASVEVDHVDTPGSPWIQPNGTLSNTVVVGGSADSPLGNPLLVFSDNYFTMRYRAKDANAAGDGWSRWMTPKLVESWIKRALDGINPFNQRTDDLFNNPVSTDVSILTQAGTRWEGDVALTLDNLDDFGLIEIYETLLNRAKNLSIDAGYDDPGTNDTLLLAAGYLNDLYIVLGNEASDDADNPTIAIDSETETSAINTSRFSFEGQVPSLIEEELALLRGRDDFLAPGVTGAPAYNRLFWNYINGINSGESIYAVNYDIQEKAGGPYADGTLDASDAYHMFPQGHGDAYGHYLTALTGYYKLLTSPHFTWTPRSEAVDVLGETLQVDYQDERKFAAAAANVARVGARILDLTARATYRDDPAAGWAHQRDGETNSATGVSRAWGTDEWASRAGQGAYFHWISANAMLPDKDENPQHHGIQIVDRTTVPELSEIVSSAEAIQATLDAQCARLNPLGLAHGAIAFDISPTALKAGESHYEQIYGRALQASLNAKAAFDQACVMNRHLRSQNDSLNDYNNAVEDQETAYQYQLIELLGSPYPGDVGPGKLYEQGYAGPDLYHYYFINRPSALVDTGSTVTSTFREPVEMNPFTEWSLDNVYDKINDPPQFIERSYTISPDKMMQFPPSGYGSRSQPGALQSALLGVYDAQVNALEASNQLDTLMRQFDRDYQLFTEFRTAYDDANVGAAEKLDQAASYLKASATLTNSAALLELSGDFISAISEATAEAFPTSAGLSFDATSVARGLSVYSGATTAYAQGLSALALDNTVAYLEAEAENLSSEADDFYAQYDWDNEDKQHVVEFERLLDEVLNQRFELTRRLSQLQRATEEVSRLLAKSNQILAERETFRQRAASVIQGYRTRDMTYRTLRNEELSQYQALYDLAAQYTYLTVQSYDYETGLLGNESGQSIIDGVIATRSLGNFQNDRPVAATGTTGDGGLASLLARLQSDWSVVKSRLGINNPDPYGTLFSLRQELFRIRTDEPSEEDNKIWQQALEQHIMGNVLNDPDVAESCLNLRKPDGSSVPGFVIPFGTTIAHGLNFFGYPLASGDHAYTASNFATKIQASGVVLKGYVGMDPYSAGTPGAGGPASSAPNSLSATPYVYLIPAGVDSMLASPLGDTAVVRSWAVKDQAVPLPFDLGNDDFAATQFFTPQGTLNEQLWITRKHQAFRPVNDASYFYSTLPSEFTNSRLVGRSVWNSQWKLVIPAYTLLNNESEALDRFVRSVSDIQLFLRTYSHSGN
ncbi:hypothetical protein [Haloferula sargassicola]|uniref:PA14 domain-containing protein n=1 Tax=Haloferula sargassicola TaxID=490096 RepID=A0ABP9UKX3_9BACT